MDDAVAVQLHANGVAEVTLNRPSSLNALSPELIEALTVTVRQLDVSDAARVLLLCGAGKHFCAGANIKAMLDMSVAEAVRAGFTGCCHALAQVEKPVVAAVQGYAVGGGCELVEMCDVVIAASTAVFGHPEITLGTMPGAGGSQRLPRAIGKHKALDMLLTGRTLDAQEAERAGLVSRLCPPDGLRDEALAVAGRIASYSLPVLKLVKASAYATFNTPLEHGLPLERASFHRTLSFADAREGMEAFRDKRTAHFRDC
ncbi:enoyl-CoA hydratase/isomerase family protein [Aquabacter sp. L1I39]|uniref:enoyl-CoA hydratase-related protein n=1 Tax=Aquabacter sp. L1I39 TaxID=2820278 RepID=UPI001ADA35CF|nr:enoyl-CoA hydratase-related protein [Aquabacter sp. L1I39]QTL04664.1 enoyl-CoA hydratase/isomerase family protein [Aquabacter sp. L1I39]